MLRYATQRAHLFALDDSQNDKRLFTFAVLNLLVSVANRERVYCAVRTETSKYNSG